MERRVLYVITGLGWGGAESQVIALATGLKRRGWDVQLVSLLAKAERRQTLEAVDIPVHTLGMRHGIADPRAIWRLAAIIRSFRPSIVHAHMVHANILARVTRILVRMPVLVTSAHNVNEGGGWRPLAYRFTDPLTDLTTNVSDAAVERYVAIKAAPAERIRFVPNGIDCAKYQRNAEDRARIREELGLTNRFVWLAVGRFEPQKDYPNMVEALSQVIQQPRAPVRLLIAGDGPLRDDIAAQVDRLGLAEYVHFLGIRSDIPALMSAADSYLMSSAWEGLPIALLEAAASQLPIVATDVGGNSQIVHHGLTGELVPPRDPSTLADAMLRMMMRSEDERTQMGAQGRAHVEKTFGMTSVLSQWERIYHELWDKRHNRRALAS